MFWIAVLRNVTLRSPPDGWVSDWRRGRWLGVFLFMGRLIVRRVGPIASIFSRWRRDGTLLLRIICVRRCSIVLIRSLWVIRLGGGRLSRWRGKLLVDVECVCGAWYCAAAC